MKQITPANDEATRKDLVEFILYKAGYLLDEETEHRFVEYLERQKEQKEPFSCGHENGGISEKPKQEQPNKETILRICKLHKAWSIIAPWENVEDFITTNWNAENIV